MTIYMEHYKVIRYLNEGSFGKIYLVERKNTKQQFALKTINLQGIDRYQKINTISHN